MQHTPENMGLPFRWCLRIEEYPDTGCWLWIGASSNIYGYGVTYWKGKTWVAHRAIYTYINGEVPPHLDVDHLCGVRPCVNPGHLEPVTRAVNLSRGEGPATTRTRHSKVTHCPRGHEYSEGNTRFSVVQTWTVRYCRECKRIKTAERRARNA